VKKTPKGIGLLSGGLDSILAVKILQEQSIDLMCLRFTTPFFAPKDQAWPGHIDGVEIRLIDIGNNHLQMLRNPRYGYGSQMNPCIDCHALMLREAGLIMEQTGADFLFTGEVLGQRPMSQRRDSLRSVEKLAGYPGRVLRPLSARLLPPTIVEIEGLIDRDRLLDIQGRSRKRQMALADRYNITDYEQPGGGCLLTKETFSRKLKHLLECLPRATTRELEMLKWGRLFRLGDDTILVIGRNEKDNLKLSSLAVDRDVVLSTVGFPGPLGLLLGNPIARDNLAPAARIVASYCDAPDGHFMHVSWKFAQNEGVIGITKTHRNHHMESAI